MWTFVPWIEEKWELGLFYFYFFFLLLFLFAVLKIVVFVGATVCYACKTASLLHELGSDCMHVYYVRMSLLLTLSVYVFATAIATAAAVPCECILYLFECMNCSCILLCVRLSLSLSCYSALSWKFCARVFNSFVYVFYCSTREWEML